LEMVGSLLKIECMPQSTSRTPTFPHFHSLTRCFARCSKTAPRCGQRAWTLPEAEDRLRCLDVHMISYLCRMCTCIIYYIRNGH
jgi:hypothetical protein